MVDFELDTFDQPDDRLDDDAARADAAAGDDDTYLDDIDQPYYQPGDAAAGGSAETSLITPVGLRQAADAEGLTLKQKTLATAVDDYYNALAKKGIIPPMGRDINKFVLDLGGCLRLEAHPDINIINTNTGRPNTLNYVAKQIKGGGEIVRQDLGFSDWNPGAGKQKLQPAADSEINREDQHLSEVASNIESAPLEDLGQRTSEAIKSAEKIVAVLTREGLTPRDIIGMCRALERSRGEHTNNLAKLTELDKHIALEERKLEEAPDETTKNIIAERLRKLQDERADRLEAASATREALRSQISRIRETLHRILHEDTTLGERIRTLFREQGITVVSILTALGMTISTIVLALTGGSGGGTAPPQPPQPPGKGGVKEWLKKHLQSLGRILAKLAGKAAAALPGIIGSIVSWLLPLLGKTAVWLSSNLWAVLLAVGGLLLVAAREWLLPKKPKQS